MPASKTQWRSVEKTTKDDEKMTDKNFKQSSLHEVARDHDEGPRLPLAALEPVYPGDLTTAGNASDGAAAVTIDADLGARRGLPIFGSFCRKAIVGARTTWAMTTAA